MLTTESMELIMVSELLSNLEYLVLAQNQIKCLPTKFSNVLIKSLKLIDLRDNTLRKSGIHRAYFNIVILGYETAKKPTTKANVDKIWEIDSSANNDKTKSSNLIVFKDVSALHLV